jgi:hypothetical protein
MGVELSTAIQRAADVLIGKIILHTEVLTPRHIAYGRISKTDAITRMQHSTNGTEPVVFRFVYMDIHSIFLKMVRTISIQRYQRMLHQNTSVKYNSQNLH